MIISLKLLTRTSLQKDKDSFIMALDLLMTEMNDNKMNANVIKNVINIMSFVVISVSECAD